MLTRTTLLVACIGAMQAGCGTRQGSEPAPNPNALSCTGVDPGDRFAAPLTTNSNCWEEDNVKLVLRGTAPKDGGTTTFRVHGKDAVGTLTRHDLPHANAGCHMKMSLQDLGLECRGNVRGDFQLLCYRGGDPKPVCGIAWTVTEPYNQYHPVDEFPKYIDDHPGE